MGSNITAEQFEKDAFEVLKMTKRGLLEFLYGMKLIKDKEYYTVYGFNNMEDFAENEYDLARASLFRYLRVANKFLPNIMNGEEMPSVPHGGLSSLGIAKLEVLTALDENSISGLLANGEITLNSQTYSIQDLKEMDRELLRFLITGKEEPPPGEEEKEIPFIKVYARVERYFNHIMNNVLNCSEISGPDKKKIELFILQVEGIFESYKRDAAALNKIK